MGEKNPAAGALWGIEVAPENLPLGVLKRYRELSTEPDWTASAVDFKADSRGVDTDFAIVLHRQKGADFPGKFDTNSGVGVTDDSNKGGVSAGKSIRTLSGQNLLRAGSLAWPDQAGQTVIRKMAVSDGDADAVVFGELASVQAMGTGETRVVIGYDTEFVSDSQWREIVSYQFFWIDPLDRVAHEVVIMPLEGQRLLFEDTLFVVSCIGRLHRYGNGFNDPADVGKSRLHPLGVRRSELSVGTTDWRFLRELFDRGRIPIVLAGHNLEADVTAFRRPDDSRRDVLKRLTSAGGGLVSLYPVRFYRSSGTGSSRRFLPFSVVFRDTMNQVSPDHKSLESIGRVVGLEKLDVGDAIENMRQLSKDDLSLFLNYAARDSEIVVRYLASVWGENIVPPVTISSGGASALKAGILSYWADDGWGDSISSGVSEGAYFRRHFQGLRSIPKGVEPEEDGDQWYLRRNLEPIDGDARVAHAQWADAFHGGYNACLKPGFFPFDTFDHDLKSAYPSALGCVFDPDYSNGVIKRVIKDRVLTLDDFPLGALTPIVAHVAWAFPESVEPCLSVQRGNSLVYPRTSYGCGFGEGERLDAEGLNAAGEDRGGRDETYVNLEEIASGELDVILDSDVFHGANCAAPELYLALKLGAKVYCQFGLEMELLEREGVDGIERSRSLRSALSVMVSDRKKAKKTYGKKSLQELTLKVAANSCYGKLAQDVVDQNGWNAYAEEMENIGGSSVTSPYHAAMATSLIRASLLALTNQTEVLSATTDGVISPCEDLNDFDLFGLADVLRESLHALTGEDDIWEIKHEQNDLLNLSTRANVSRLDGGVLAKGGLRTPKP